MFYQTIKHGFGFQKSQRYVNIQTLTVIPTFDMVTLVFTFHCFTLNSVFGFVFGFDIQYEMSHAK